MKKLIQHPIFAFCSMLLGLGLCAGLFYYLKLPASGIQHMFTHSLWPTIILVPLSLTILLMLTGAWKWKILTKALAGEKGGQEEQGYSFFLRHYLWQNWIGLFVPPSVAIVAGRGIAQRHQSGFKSGALNGFWDQFLEFAFLAVLIPVGLFFLLGKIGVVELVSVSALLHFILGALFWLISRALRPTEKSCALSVLFLSSLRVFLTIVRLAVGATTLGLTISFWKISASAPIVSLLALIPVTPGNLGIAEWGWTGVLVWAGSNPIEAGMLAIGFRLLVMMIQTLILGLYELFECITSKTHNNP